MGNRPVGAGLTGRGVEHPPPLSPVSAEKPLSLDGPPPLECSLPVKPRPILTPTLKGAPPVWIPAGLLFQPVIPSGPPSARIMQKKLQPSRRAGLSL